MSTFYNYYDKKLKVKVKVKKSIIILNTGNVCDWLHCWLVMTQ
jgi:hypothetical protein